MPGEAGAAALHRFLVVAGTAMFFSELGERNRCRVCVDAALQFENARVVYGHVVSIQRRARPMPRPTSNVYGLTGTVTAAVEVAGGRPLSRMVTVAV
jgi:hypothetical protein